jgi:hypothetical protein
MKEITEYGRKVLTQKQQEELIALTVKYPRFSGKAQAEKVAKMAKKITGSPFYVVKREGGWKVGEGRLPNPWYRRCKHMRSKRRNSPRQLAYRKLVKRYGVKGASRHWKKRK